MTPKKAVCMQCGRTMPTVRAGWANYCYECEEKNVNSSRGFF